MQEDTQQPRAAARIHGTSARASRETLPCGGSGMLDEQFGNKGLQDPDHGHVQLVQLHPEPNSLEKVPGYPHPGQF
jgi:hypothetical protein